MQTIMMSLLTVGDIFCHELKISGREAFEVKQINEKTIICKSRNTGKEIRKQKDGSVILLRHKEDATAR